MLDEPTKLPMSQDVVIVTGPSGAGRTTAIRALEDLGFEAIDNLPLDLVERVLSSAPIRPLAIGVDPRTRGFEVTALCDVLDVLAGAPGVQPSLLFLDASVDVLLRRFSETRRRHPLATAKTLLDGVEQERAMLEPLRPRADVLIDTSDLSPHDLRSELSRWFGGEAHTGLVVSVQSFSYKKGTPRSADMVIDCRFLRNPHWEPELRPKTGLDAEVGAYVSNDPLFAAFFEKTAELVMMLLPAYKKEGKSYFTIAFGCTGGKHRSVYISENMANRLAQDGWQVSIRHREIADAPQPVASEGVVTT